MAEKMQTSDTESDVEDSPSPGVSPSKDSSSPIVTSSPAVSPSKTLPNGHIKIGSEAKGSSIVKTLYEAVLDKNINVVHGILFQKLVSVDHIFTVNELGGNIQSSHNGCGLVHILSEIKKVQGDQKLELLKYVLSLGANVRIPNSKGDLALHTACRIGNHKAVRLLLEQDSTCKDVPNHHGITPLIKALYYFNYQFKSSYLKVLDALLKAGCDVNLCPKSGVSPLHVAVEKDVDLVSRLVHAGANVNVVCHKGESPLLKVMCVVRKNNTLKQGVVKVLVEAGADTSIQTQIGRTPLHLAVALSDDINAKVILESGADPDSEDQMGVTPMLLAVGDHNMKIVPLLVHHGADLNRKQRQTGNNETSPLTKAIGHHDLEMLQLLLDLGAQYTKEMIASENPLLRAMFSNNAAMVRLLLYQNILPHYPAYAKVNAGLLRMAMKNFGIFRALLEVGRNLDMGEVLGICRGKEEFEAFARQKACTVSSLSHLSCLQMREQLGLDIKGKLQILYNENQIPASLVPMIMLDQYLKY